MFTRFTILAALAGAFFIVSLSPTLALSETQQDAAIASLQSAVASLQSNVSNLQSTVSSQQAMINAQAVTIHNQQSIIAFFTKKTDSTRSDHKEGTELFITGCNVHVVNGLGATNGTPNDPFGGGRVNGLGNVIIGYNDSTESAGIHTGSHNLVLGDEHNYSSFGGIVAGEFSTVSGPYASVLGGFSNTASGEGSIVCSGEDNNVSGYFSSILGGEDNMVTGGANTVSGGFSNLASGDFASVGGGSNNLSSGYGSFVGGGGDNTANGDFASVCGGSYVLESSSSGFAAGGSYSPASPGPGKFHSP